MDSKDDSDSDSSVEENKRMPDEDCPFTKVIHPMSNNE